MSKKKPAKKAARAVVKPPKVQPRQPKLKHRKLRKGHVLREETMPLELETPEDLGPRLLPNTREALTTVLSEAADLNDAALQAHKAFLELDKKAKTAKKVWQDKVAETQRYIRLSTHESELPLLSAAEQEEDLERMTETRLGEAR